MTQTNAPRALLPLLARAIGWLLFALLILLCVLPQGSTRVFTWPWVFYAQLLMLSPLLLAGWIKMGSTDAPPVGGGPLALCALSIGLSVVLSRNPHFSFEAGLSLWGGLALIYWLAHRLRVASSTEDRFRTTARVAGLALVAPLLSSLSLWGGSIGPQLAAAGSPGDAITALSSVRNPYPFGHANYTGAYALIVLPWLTSLAWVERGRWRAGWSLGAAICPLLIFSSASRGAVLGALFLLAAALALALITGRISRRSGLWLLIAGVVLAAFLALTNARLRTLLTDPSALQYPSLGDVQRLAMLQGGVLLGQQRPWVGHGPGMVPFVYPKVRAELVGGVETSFQLHNAYLHLWVTTGILGVTAALMLVGSLVRGTRRWLRQPPGIARTFALGSAAALVGYAGMAATDYQLDVIGIVAALSLQAALVLAGPAAASATEQAPRLRRTPLRFPRTLSFFSHHLSAEAIGFIIIGSGLTAAAFLIPHWEARHLHWNAWAATPEGDRLDRQSKLLAASKVAPWNTHYRNQHGLQLARAAKRPDQSVERRAARDVLFSSLALDAAQEPIHASLAWLWLPDDPHKAGIEFQRALALIPDRDTLYHGLAVSRLNKGDEEGAVRALALECLVNPRFLASPFWVQAELAVVSDRVITQLDKLIRRASIHSEMPRWRQRDLAYFLGFLRWWKGGSAPTSAELAGADERQRAFFSAHTSDSRLASSWPAPWEELARAIDGSNITVSNLLPGGGSQAAWDGAMARLQTGVTSIPELVRSESPRNVGMSGLIVERAHYPLMHRNLDGPGYRDLAPRAADAFRQRYSEPLFPPRGLIPGRVLDELDELDENR